MLIVSEEAERRYSRTRTANSSALHLTADLTIMLKGTEELEFRIRIRIGGVLIDGCYKPASANQQPPCLERMGARDSIALMTVKSDSRDVIYFTAVARKDHQQVPLHPRQGASYDKPSESRRLILIAIPVQNLKQTINSNHISTYL
jgi:hypothetical protein